MSKLSKFRKKGNDEGVWASISDMMSGLMIVFLFIAVAFMSRVADENIKIKNQQDTIEKVVETYENTKGNIYIDLVNEFKDDMDSWNMKIDEDGTVRFTEPEVFFETGKADLTDKFTTILDQFFPRYIKLIYDKYSESITEIRIEGHTSSEWDSVDSELESYFGNMELSQGRTRNVLRYVMQLGQIKDYQKWLIEKITANGMSYSKMIVNEDGSENREKSRRVEFKIITNSEEIISDIVEEYKK